MNMKAIFFAGGGLMLSMVLTTAWISNDMQRIKEREAAKREAACAATLATGTAAPATTPGMGDPTVAAAAPAADPAACTDGTQNGTGAVDPNGAAVDPALSDPGAVDPGAANAASMDPGSLDPGASDPGYVDPGYAEPGYADPGYVDPAAAGATAPDPNMGYAQP